MTALLEVPIERIKPPKFSLRASDNSKVDELAQSIKTQGLLQPITVTPITDGFEIIFGQHRFEACKKLGLKTVSCQVKTATDTEACLMAEAENLQRNEYVDPTKEAYGFSLLLRAGMTQEEIGQRIGRSQQYVSSRLQLLGLELDTLHLISERIISPEHGLELSKIQDPRKRRVLATLSRKDRDGSLNLHQLREAAKKTLEELAVDSYVEWLIVREDPAWGVWRLNSRVWKLEKQHNGLKAEVQTGNEVSTRRVDNLGNSVSLLANPGFWKRDHCAHNSGGVCQKWSWTKPIANWVMVQVGGTWRLNVSEHPEYCATCPNYAKKL